MLTLIVGRARNHAIGKDNTIPWHAPEDLRMFQRETLGGALIMGRKTWESLPVRPLKNRLNCVVSRSPDLGDRTCGSVADAVAACYAAGYRRVYGIGGQSVYAELLPLADRMLITEVDLVIEDADAYFPEFEDTDWHEQGRFTLRTDTPRCELRELIRKRG